MSLFVVGLLLTAVSYSLFLRVRKDALSLVVLFIIFVTLALLSGRGLQLAVAEGLLATGGWLVGTGILVFLEHTGRLQAFEKRKRSEKNKPKVVETAIVLADDGELSESIKVKHWFVEISGD